MDDKPKVRRVDFYPGDWLGGTIGMRADEIGVYIQICALIYDRGGPVHIDQVRAASGLHGNALRRVLVKLREIGKIEGKDSEIFQKRCGNELEKSQKLIEKARENGAKGNDIRWNHVATPSLDGDPSGARFLPPPPPDSKSLKNRGRGKWKRAGTVTPEIANATNSNPAAPTPEPIVGGYNGPTPTPRGDETGIWRMRLQWYLNNPAVWDGKPWGPPPTDPHCWLLTTPDCKPYAYLLDELGLRPPT